MFVRGTVVDIDHQTGSIDQPGQPAGSGFKWHTVNVTLNTGERIKFPHTVDQATGTSAPRGQLQVPALDDRVEVVIDLELKQNPNSLLKPFTLTMVALEAVVLDGAASIDAARAARSVASQPARRSAKAG